MIRFRRWHPKSHTHSEAWVIDPRKRWPLRWRAQGLWSLGKNMQKSPGQRRETGPRTGPNTTSKCPGLVPRAGAKDFLVMSPWGSDGGTHFPMPFLPWDEDWGGCGGQDQDNQGRGHFSTGPPISTGRRWDSSWASRDRLRAREALLAWEARSGAAMRWSGLPCWERGGASQDDEWDALQSMLCSLRMRAAQEEGAAWARSSLDGLFLFSASYCFKQLQIYRK